MSAWRLRIGFLVPFALTASALAAPSEPPVLHGKVASVAFQAVAGADAIVLAVGAPVHVGPPRDYQPTRAERIRHWMALLVGPVAAFLVFLASVLLYRASRSGSNRDGGSGGAGGPNASQ